MSQKLGTLRYCSSLVIRNKTLGNIMQENLYLFALMVGSLVSNFQASSWWLWLPTDGFVPYLVGDLEGRFSHDEALIV